MNEPKLKLHLTDSYQLKSANQLISKLTQANAANEEYIAELEEENLKLKSYIKQLEDQNKKILDKYSSDMKSVLINDEMYNKYKEKIAELKKERDSFKEQRDQCIIKLLKVNV